MKTTLEELAAAALFGGVLALAVTRNNTQQATSAPRPVSPSPTKVTPDRKRSEFKDICVGHLLVAYLVFVVAYISFVGWYALDESFVYLPRLLWWSMTHKDSTSLPEWA